MQLFSKNSNLCHHDTSTSQTTFRSNTVLCVASRGKNETLICIVHHCRTSNAFDSSVEP